MQLRENGVTGVTPSSAAQRENGVTGVTPTSAAQREWGHWCDWTAVASGKLVISKQEVPYNYVGNGLHSHATPTCCITLRNVCTACVSCSIACLPYLASYPGSFPLTARGRKEPGNIGGFKPLTSGAWILAAPIRLQNESTCTCDYFVGVF